MLFAIVDIETTGGSARSARITEIAVLIHDGYQVLDTFHTLLNPQQYIPAYITGLTGIDEAMVAEAPTFGEIAQELLTLLEDKVFVAHNVNFDYGFIREAFSSIGISYESPKLCTVQLSRKAFPGFPSYSLGRICEHLRIHIQDRHRAFGDAEATAQLFGMIFEKNEDIILGSLRKRQAFHFLPPQISEEKFLSLPEETGIYYFLDEKGVPIYIGKALNIRSRFKQHFSGKSEEEEKFQLKSLIRDVQWKLTGSELLACLLELQEIKHKWPKFNKAAKFKTMSWGIVSYEDGNGYLRLQVAKITKGTPSIAQFNTHAEAFHLLKHKVLEYEMCPKLAGIQKSADFCFDHKKGDCKGACGGLEIPELYNLKVRQFIQTFSKERGRLLIQDLGRTAQEHSVLYFEDGIFQGYTFLEATLEKTSAIVDKLIRVQPERDSQYLLKAFFPKIAVEKIQVL
ncbi:exonuclease domain-containing protein [Mongoliitalea daihaiensis]|uniref:exonuclease domain-containing protein n=1 Tax=Mongoliitalea daihaiensis TaxID=2782006 RepID=UPI001F19A216|nr:exonuclease domain-containing protein [Mongoliitalea daihaiensis]UJP64225.1 GIY-YIG nuclease family protein [Mongoliitalea daihaiensis]